MWESIASTGTWCSNGSRFCKRLYAEVTCRQRSFWEGDCGRFWYRSWAKMASRAVQKVPCNASRNMSGKREISARFNSHRLYYVGKIHFYRDFMNTVNWLEPLFAYFGRYRSMWRRRVSQRALITIRLIMTCYFRGVTWILNPTDLWVYKAKCTRYWCCGLIGLITPEKGVLCKSGTQRRRDHNFRSY